MRVSSVRARVVLALVVLLLPLLLLYQLAGMDHRLSRTSWSGLARYLIGDYRGAAIAYRVDLAKAVASRRADLDPAWAAFVEGRLADATARAEEQIAGGAPTEGLLTLAEIALSRSEPRRALGLV